MKSTIRYMALVLVVVLCTLPTFCQPIIEFNVIHDPWALYRQQAAMNVEFFKDEEFIMFHSTDSGSIANGSYTRWIGHTVVSSTGIIQADRAIKCPSGYEGLSVGEHCVIPITGGGYMIASVLTVATPIYHLGLIRLNENADSLWSVIHEPDPGESWLAQEIHFLPDQGYLIVGTNITGISGDGFLLRTDSLGQEVWRTNFGDPAVSESVYASALAPDGGYMVVGVRRIGLTGSIYHVWVTKFDAYGTPQWESIYPMHGFRNFPLDIIGLSNGGFIVVGSSRTVANSASYAYDQFIMKLDDNGNELWTTYNSLLLGGQTMNRTACELADGRIATVGAVDIPGYTGHFKGHLGIYYPDGTFAEQHQLQYLHPEVPLGNGIMRDMLLLDDGSIVAGGSMFPEFGATAPIPFGQDPWLVKIQLNDISTTVPRDRELVQTIVYPNPSNGQFTIERNDLLLANTLFEIFTSDGRSVQRGSFTGSGTTVDLKHLPDGIYSIHLWDRDHRSVHQVALVH